MDTTRPVTWSVLILTRDEAANLERLLPQVAATLRQVGVTFEMIVVDAHSTDGTTDVATRHGARVVLEQQHGYAAALRQGFAACRGTFILAVDADLSHPPEYFTALMQAAETADLVVASRYVPGGRAHMPPSRRFLSHVLNGVFRVVLALPVRDLSSGFRVYRREALSRIEPRGEHFDILPEIAALGSIGGWRVSEVPFDYRLRVDGVSKARVMAFAPAYLRTLARCWRVRRTVLRGPKK